MHILETMRETPFYAYVIWKMTFLNYDWCVYSDTWKLRVYVHIYTFECEHQICMICVDMDIQYNQAKNQ